MLTIVLNDVRTSKERSKATLSKQTPRGYLKLPTPRATWRNPALRADLFWNFA